MGLPMRLNFRPNVLMLCGFVFFLYIWIIFSSDSPSESHIRGSQFVDLKRLLIASVIAAERGGDEVRKARENPLNVVVKGKTREGVLDVITQADSNSNLIMVNTLSFTFPGMKIISEENLSGGTDFVKPITFEQTILDDLKYANIPDDILLPIKDLTVWIDPLDATKEYSEGLTDYVTTMVCVASNGKPILGVIHRPFFQQTFWSTKFGIDKKLLKLRNVYMKKNETIRFIVSRSHKGDVVKRVQQSFHNKFTVIDAAGSGYKTLELFHGKADIYLHTTHIKKWDICAPHAFIKYASEGDLQTLNGHTIQYGEDASSLNPDGVFASLNPDLIKYRKMFEK